MGTRARLKALGSGADVLCVSVVTTPTSQLSTRIAPPDLGLGGSADLAYQPAVDLATGRLLGFEALLRWNSPAGVTPPGTFIPWAEANGHMGRLNAWILAEACAQAARWPAAIQVSVNCSLPQLRRGEVSVATAHALESSGLNPERLTVEVTEAAVIDPEAGTDLRAIAALGAQLAVDDIGSDWSVLDRLRELAVHTMKIDGANTAGVAAADGLRRTIVETIVNLSHSLGICTVAEAVETLEQVEVLRELGVDVAQGYFFSAPHVSGHALALAAMDPIPCLDLTRSVAERTKLDEPA